MYVLKNCIAINKLALIRAPSSFSQKTILIIRIFQKNFQQWCKNVLSMQRQQNDGQCQQNVGQHQRNKKEDITDGCPRDPLSRISHPRAPIFENPRWPESHYK